MFGSFLLACSPAGLLLAGPALRLLLAGAADVQPDGVPRVLVAQRLDQRRTAALTVMLVVQDLRREE